jgi:hypothetical protein
MAAGALIAGLGIILLLGQLGSVFSVVRLWPLLIVAIGVSRLFSPMSTVIVDGNPSSGQPYAHRREIGFHPRRGAALIAIGLWLLLDQMRIVRAWVSWPLLLIAIGGWLVWCGVRDGNEAR